MSDDEDDEDARTKCGDALCGWCHGEVGVVTIGGKGRVGNEKVKKCQTEYGPEAFVALLSRAGSTMDWESLCFSMPE